MNKFLLILLTLSICLISGCIEDPQINDDVRNAKAPEVETGDTTAITATSVTISGKVKKENGARVTQYGFVWGTKNPVTLENMEDSLRIPVHEAQFSTIVAGLSHNKEYYIAAFAGNAAGVAVGSSIGFTTKKGLGHMKTLQPYDIKAESAVAGGEIEDPGEGEITSRGVYYWKKGTSQRESVLSTMQTNSFTCLLTGLSPATEYYVLAFATSQFGTIEGSTQQLFKTTTGRATVISFEKLTVDYTYAEFKATVSSEGDAPVTERGFCYTTTLDPPTTANDIVRCGTSTGEFTGRLDNLLPNKRYYVKAYAINTYGVEYSPETLTVITKNDYPTVVLRSAVLTSTPGVAHVSGEVQDQGNSEITAVGVCWSTTSQFPTKGTDNYLSFAASLGIFEGNMTGLRGGQTYYVRAYASNLENTSYSEEAIAVTTPSIFKNVVSFTDGTRTPGSVAYFKIQSEAFFFGGDAGTSHTNSLWRYTTSEGLVQRSSANVEKMAWMSVACVNFSAFVFGGKDESNQLTDNLYRYSALDNAWTKLAVVNGPAPVARAAGCSVGMNVYFIGGVRKPATSEVVSGEVWMYDAQGDTWESRPSFPEPQCGGLAFVIDNVVYSGLGITQIGTTQMYTKKLYKSTSTTLSSWVEETTMPGGNVMAGTIHKNQLFVVDDSGYIWRYDLGTKEWKQKSQLAVDSRTVHCMYSIGDLIYIGMGTNKMLITYDPTWDN